MTYSKIQCEKCSKKPICKYETEYLEIRNKLMHIRDNDFFSLSLVCDQYQQIVPTPRVCGNNHDEICP